MGYDFSPRRKEAGGFYLGAYSWPWMLGEGVGLPIGYSNGIRPGTYYYEADDQGRSPTYNDGYQVTAKQARMMALCARTVATRFEMIALDFAKLDGLEKQVIEKNRAGRYTLPVREDFVVKCREWAEWAEKSGGFAIW